MGRARRARKIAATAAYGGGIGAAGIGVLGLVGYGVLKAEALLASRSAIAGAVNALENLDLIHRSRAAGERMDRVRIDLSSARGMGFDVSEYREQGELAREGLQTIADASAERRAVLLELAAFADFLAERIPALEQDWKTHREALRDAGELPGDPPH